MHMGNAIKCIPHWLQRVYIQWENSIPSLVYINSQQVKANFSERFVLSSRHMGYRKLVNTNDTGTEMKCITNEIYSSCNKDNMLKGVIS